MTVYSTTQVLLTRGIDAVMPSCDAMLYPYSYNTGGISYLQRRSKTEPHLRHLSRRDDYLVAIAAIHFCSSFL